MAYHLQRGGGRTCSSSSFSLAGPLHACRGDWREQTDCIYRPHTRIRCGDEEGQKKRRDSWHTLAEVAALALGGEEDAADPELGHHGRPRARVSGASREGWMGVEVKGGGRSGGGGGGRRRTPLPLHGRGGADAGTPVRIWSWPAAGM